MNAPHDLSTFDALSPGIGADVLTDAGFFLVDDAGGRFNVDRELGIVSVADEAILARELGSVHAARLRVIEPSGERYDLDLKLRLTGRVPQVVGAEDFGAIAIMATGLSEQIANGVAISIAPPAPPAAPATSWTRYAAALGVHGKADLIRTRRAFITAELPATSTPPTRTALSLTESPPAVGAHAPWSL
jgi:hypothetical protein